MAKLTDFPVLSAREVVDRTIHVMNVSRANRAAGLPPVPVLLWGTHGIGKTKLLEAQVKSQGVECVLINLASFEEAGDLNGYPEVTVNPETGEKETTFIPPAWVPTDPDSKGVLILDDVNRADPRILNAAMQLVQDHEIHGCWSLPVGWVIVGTANPTGDGYSVSDMDDAQMTRWAHFSMKFEAKVWAEWATKNDIDPRLIAFVLTYPESITGKRSCARTLQGLSSVIKGVSDKVTIHTMARAFLDQSTVNALVSFLDDDLAKLVSPEEILDAVSFAPVKSKIVKLLDGNGMKGKRVDRINVILDRLQFHLSALPDDVKNNFPPKWARNVVSLMDMDEIPKDLVVSLHRSLSFSNPGTKMIAAVRSKKVAMGILEAM